MGDAPAEPKLEARELMATESDLANAASKASKMTSSRRSLFIGFLGGALAVTITLALAGFFLFQKLPDIPLFVNDRVLSAVAKFGEQRTGRARNTFYFPTNANLGDEMVIYWREENLLLSFPTNLTDDAAKSPGLVVRRIWKLNEESFRLPGDQETKTSTYLETWPQAAKWLRDAAVDGQKLVLEHHAQPASLPKNP